MSVEIIVLSVLRAGPVHGYELKRRVARPSLTPLSNNSLYPMLRRFEQQGLVTKSVEEHESVPPRNVYAITDAGRERLTALLSALPPELATDDEEFLMRLGFFEELPIANRRAIVAARLAALDASAATVSTLLDENSGKGTSPKHEWRAEVMSHVLQTLASERAWTLTIGKKAGV
ncbi:MAG TPA: PadR family transcriptional regulator [Galbitalea sp.]|jgi:DNA-binding PadR family transcriptional regulator|nr:PadR family transcriptional regulator [Galbitalea sp.]